MNTLICSIFFFFMVVMNHVGFAQNPPDTIPVFSGFERYDNQDTMTYLDLPKAGQIVFYFYDPGCGHCQEMGKDIADLFDQFSKDNTFYFISMNDKSYVEGYINKYVPTLRGKKNVIFLKDFGVEFFEKFDPSNYPSTYIYNAETKGLIHFIEGKKNARNLLPFLKNQ